jgi:DNA-directed RNA polymerase subunit omega
MILFQWLVAGSDAAHRWMVLLSASAPSALLRLPFPPLGHAEKEQQLQVIDDRQGLCRGAKGCIQSVNRHPSIRLSRSARERRQEKVRIVAAPCSCGVHYGCTRMARITANDCLVKIPSRFDLTLVAAKRARQLARGAEARLPWKDHKSTVLALQEIAAGHIDATIMTEADLPPIPHRSLDLEPLDALPDIR